MASQGPNFPDIGVSDNANGGTIAWSNPGNIAADDGSVAAAAMTSGATSEHLKGTDFDFAIPAGATIDGIVLEIERRGQATDRISDVDVKLVKGGAVVGDNKAAGSFWTTTLTYQSYGGASDLWGTTWTESDVNALGFGAVMSCTSTGGSSGAQVDAFRITVHYTEGGGGGGGQPPRSMHQFRMRRI